jgi:RNA polymerase sigma-70 factor (ECF subfamily)
MNRSKSVQDNESQWLIDAQRGDAGAFSALVEKYQRPVYNLCYRMLGNPQDAEDAAQETFLRAYKSLRRYDRNRSFSTWLLSIAAHYCIDQIRRRRYTVVSVEELPVPDLPDHQPGLESGLSRREEQRQVRALLEVLDSTDRAAVVMYYWYDFSYKEISQALSLTESAVKSRLHRARRAMAVQWMEEQPPQARGAQDTEAVARVDSVPTAQRPETFFAERMTP